MGPALAFLAGDRTPEVLAELAARMHAWAAQEPAGDALGLHRYMGLHSPASTRRALRDAVLRELAAMLEDGTPWQRACELAERARSFDLRKWDHWQHLEDPPDRATPIEVKLFRARKWCELPTTARGFYNLL